MKIGEFSPQEKVIRLDLKNLKNGLFGEKPPLVYLIVHPGFTRILAKRYLDR